VGNTNRWESYAPTNEAAVANDAWYHSLSAVKLAIYECVASGIWRLRYTTPDVAATTTGGAPYTLPIATGSALGGVKSMGAGLAGNVTVNADGSMTAPASQGGASTFSQLGGLPTDNAALATSLSAKADLIGGKVPLTQLPAPLTRLLFRYPAGQNTIYECPIVYLNGVQTNPPFNVVIDDVIAIQAITMAGIKGNVILRLA
jgi:hypothetical protein